MWVAERVSMFKPITQESLERILKGKSGVNISDNQDEDESFKLKVDKSERSKGKAPKETGETDEQKKKNEQASKNLEANQSLVSGKKLPPSFGDYFPKKLAGVPLEDIDSYYSDKKVYDNIQEVKIDILNQDL